MLLPVLGAALAACPVARGVGASQGLLERRRGSSHESFAQDGSTPGGGLACMRWRKTLNCAPSGPRDPLGDKDCSVTITGTESGFCECEGYVHVAAVPCGHRPINCDMECEKVIKLVREVFGANYTDVKKKGLPVYDEGRDPYTRAREYGDKAVHSVNQAVSAANAGLNAARDMISRMMSLKPWNEIAKAGQKAEDAGMKAQEMAKMARPFIYGQISAARRQTNATHKEQ